MKYHDQSYNPNGFNLITLLIVIISLVLGHTIPMGNLTKAVLFFYFFAGGISDLLVSFIIRYCWSHKSLQNVEVVNPSLVSDLEEVSWLPRVVGIFDRLIFTSSFILGKYELIAIWLGLKVVGSWKDNFYENSKIEKEPRIQLWRIKENIFLIGVALSLILSYISAIGFLKLIN